MNTNPNPSPKGPRHGRLVAQPKWYDQSAHPFVRALAAIYGQDAVDGGAFMMDCHHAVTQCPPDAGKPLSPELQAVAWRMLDALRRGDRRWFDRLLQVREGKGFGIFSGARSGAVDPLRAILGYLATLQADGKMGPVKLAEVREFVKSISPDAEPEDDKTLRTACRDMGVLLRPMKRGPKPGPRRP